MSISPATAKASPVLRNVLRECRTGFIAVLTFSLCINLLMLAAPLYTLQIFDRVLSSRSLDTLLMLTLVVLAALLTLAALDLVRNRVLIQVGKWLDMRLGNEALGGSIGLAAHYGQAASIQGLRDLTLFRSFLTSPAAFPILDAPWTPIFIAVVFLLHPILGWISLGGSIVLFILALINEATTRELFEKAGVSISGSLREAEAAVRNADVVEALGMRDSVIGRWRRLNAEGLAHHGKASERAAVFSALSKFTRLSLQVILMGVGAWFVIHGELTGGAMIAASILMSRALLPVEQAIGSWRLAVGAREAYMRLGKQLELGASVGQSESMSLPVPAGAVSVEGLTYAYPEAQEPILRNITFRLEAGEALGIIGPTAAGKSTLARLLVGILSPRTGHARLDSMDVSQWPSADRGRHIGYLPQDVKLFGGSVRDNIARMRAEGEYEAEEVIAAARQAGAHEMILRLTAGYETDIGEGGAHLSGGERQRIGLARALYGSPKLVVLDEPNASLDDMGEEALIKCIAVLKSLATTQVIITHRPRLVRHVDKILVLRAGQIQMFGPRDAILEKLGRSVVEFGREVRHG